MSKAFLRENDSVDTSVVAAPVSLLPPGVKNLVTAEGADRLRTELARLVESERPPLAAASEDPDAKRALQALDRRIRQLEQSLRTAEVVPPPSEPDDIVRFGAEVSVRDRTGDIVRYRLVGVDETDVDRGWISWRSPLAQALLNAHRGDRVAFAAPAGKQELEIVDVTY